MADYRRGDTASWDKEQVRRSHAAHERSAQSVRRKKKKRRVHPLIKFILWLLFVALS